MGRSFHGSAYLGPATHQPKNHKKTPKLIFRDKNPKHLGFLMIGFSGANKETRNTIAKNSRKGVKSDSLILKNSKPIRKKKG